MERLRQVWTHKSRVRRERILEAALALAEEKGFREFTRAEVAERAAIALTSINAAFGTMNALRCAVMSAAIERQRLAVVAQGLAVHDPVAEAAPYGLKKLASQSLVQ